MRLDEYTADAICQAMGLQGFVERDWERSEDPVLRVLLTPSFHPELCITVSFASDHGLLSVIALAEHFWGQRSMVHLPKDHEEARVARSSCADLVELFKTAESGFNPQRRFCCDGMGSESCLVSASGSKQLKAHVSEQKATGHFIARLIDVAWNACRQPRIRNALGEAAKYLEVEYPVDVVPKPEPVTRLLVLGTPDERADYFAMLRNTKASGA